MKIFRANISKIFIITIIIMIIISIVVVIKEWDNVGDPIALIIPLILVTPMMFVITLVVFNLPVFLIKITESYIEGPTLFATSWKRIRIPFIEIKGIVNNPILSLFGWYVINSAKGEKISAFAFAKSQYKELLLKIKQ